MLKYYKKCLTELIYTGLTNGLIKKKFINNLIITLINNEINSFNKFMYNINKHINMQFTC